MTAKRREYAPPQPGAVQFNVSCRVSLEELERLNKQQLQAFMLGMAEVLSAEKGKP